MLAAEGLQDVLVQMHVQLLLDLLELLQPVGGFRHVFFQDRHDPFVERVQVHARAQRVGQSAGGDPGAPLLERLAAGQHLAERRVSVPGSNLP